MLESHVINQYLVIVGCLIVIFSVIGINIILIKGYLIGSKLKKLTFELSKGCSEEKIIEYIKFIEKNDIPPRQYSWNLVIAASEIIEMDSKIDNKLKSRFKIAILGKGIPV